MAKRKSSDDEDLASAGHSLGQKVGDWLEESFVLPLLKQVAGDLKLFLDHRFIARKARGGEKITWKDDDDNEVDYDFVMELDGTEDHIGIPSRSSSASGAAASGTPRTRPATTVAS